MIDLGQLLPILLSIAVKAVATGSFVLAMAVLIERAPPAVASASIGFPVVIGPGFFLVALQQPTAFLEQAAAAAVLGLVATMVFMVVTGRFFGTFGPAGLLTVGVGAWAVAAFAMSELRVGVVASLAIFAAAFAASHLILPFRGSPPPTSGAPAPRRTPPFGRAIQAGLFVALVTYAADWLGDRVTAVLLAMPVAMMFLTLTLKARLEAAVATPIYRWARTGLLPLLAFVLTIHFTAVAIGNLPSVLLAFAASILCAAGVAATKHLLLLRRHPTSEVGDPER